MEIVAWSLKYAINATSTEGSTTTTTSKQIICSLSNVKHLPTNHPPNLAPTVLVRFLHVSLDNRDIAIAQCIYQSGNRESVLPCSDGAGNVVLIGERLARWKLDYQVRTLFKKSPLAGSLTAEPPKMS